MIIVIPLTQNIFPGLQFPDSLFAETVKISHLILAVESRLSLAYEDRILMFTHAGLIKKTN